MLPYEGVAPFGLGMTTAAGSFDSVQRGQETKCRDAGQMDPPAATNPCLPVGIEVGFRPDA
jgi:hypothetical protein